MKQIDRMLDGYLIVKLIIEHPESKLPVILSAMTPIKVNQYTGLAWVRSFQVQLLRHNYALVN